MISYILIGGTIISLVLISTGLIIYYMPKGIESTPHFTMKWQMSGNNLFAYVTSLISKFHFLSNSAPSSFNINAIKIMALGLITLIMTPYVRVVASIIFFSLTKNFKYVFVTGFVLLILTISLIMH